MKPVIIAVIIVILVVAIGALMINPTSTEKTISDNVDAEQVSTEFTDIIPPEKTQIDPPSLQLDAGPSDDTIETTQCDESYPDVCIPYPPDLDCDEIGYSNFRVIGNDPHGFDRDNDGIGCEVGAPFSSNTVESVPECDESYPDVCIPPYPPDLDCGEIGYSNFKVVGDDPHGFDRDNDGIGCVS